MKTLREFRQPQTFDPPVVMMLRRKAVRMFNNNQRVALYRNDVLNLDISIPYQINKSDAKFLKPPIAHFTTETVLHHIHNAVKTKQSAKVNFMNGKSGTIPHTSAALVMRLHSVLNPKNKAKLEKMANMSPEGFKKWVDFSRENIK